MAKLTTMPGVEAQVGHSGTQVLRCAGEEAPENLGAGMQGKV